MSGSALTPFNYIPENSLATPGLWNSVFSTLSQNIAEANTLGSILSGGISLGTQGLTITVPSNVTDYIFLNDSSNLRSSYAIGSFNSGTADGLNIWDASGQTMIVSFSKQSVRFYQQVVGPVFDVGGALASTLNAATFGGSLVTTQIQAAISAASNAVPKIKRVYVPASMYPYDPRQISFDTNVQMVREGGAWDVYDVQAYGAKPDLSVADAWSTTAIQAAIHGANGAGGGIVYVPAGQYGVSSVTVPRKVTLRGAGGGRYLDSTVVSELYQGSAATTILFLQDQGGSGVLVTDLQLNASGNNNNLGGVQIAGMTFCLLQRLQVSGTSTFAVQIIGGNDANANGILDCAITMNSVGTVIDIEGGPSGVDTTPYMAGCFVNANSPTAWISIKSTSSGIAPDSALFTNNRFIESTSTVTAIYALATNARFIGNRFENVNGGLNVTLAPPTGSQFAAEFIGNSWGVTGGTLNWNDSANTPSTRFQEITPSGVINQVPGIAIRPSYSVGSEASLGWYRSAASTMALSYGTLRVPGPNFLRMPTGGTGDGRLMTRSSNVLGLSINLNSSSAQDSSAGASWLLEMYGGAGDTNDQVLLAHARPNGGLGTVWSWDSLGNSSMTSGTATVPALNFLSERSLGLYKSAGSTLALSYGTFDLTASGAVTSIASLKIKSGANNSCGTAVLGSNGSVNVANTYVAAGDLIFLTDQTAGGTLGDIELGGIRAGSGFTIQSTSVTDTSTVAWLIVRPT